MNRLLITTVLAIAPAGAALAQPYQIQGGNVLDANPRLDSGGLNYGARQYQVNSTNRIVTGNVTSGAGFHGFSPVRDPSQFFLTPSGNAVLPSESLLGFRRDAIGAADVAAGRTAGSAPVPFYSRQSTVLNTGAIASGLNQPGSSAPRNPFMVPRADLRAQPINPLTAAEANLRSGSLNVAPRVERIETGQVVTGQVNPRLLSSPLFANVRAVPVDTLAAEAQPGMALGTGQVAPLDLRVSPSMVDLRVDQRTSPRPGEPLRDPGLNPEAVRDGMLPVPGTPADATAAATGQRPGDAATNRIAPQAADVFTSMRLASRGLAAPLPSDTSDDRQAKEAGPRLARPIEPITPPTAALTAGLEGPPPSARADAATEAPLRTFVGSEESAMNRYLAQAETMLRGEQYYRASSLYELAHAIDPRNPLPLLGNSMALLAAGEYMTSATNLFAAIATFESLANFPVDLKSFIPEIGVLDRRRADLERRLAQFDDYRLRFLLGYAEYNSGLEKIGVANMRKAAAAATQDRERLNRFVSVLEERIGNAPRPVDVPERK